MARASRTNLQVLTANRLIGGDVVYAARSGWTEIFAEAEVFISPESAEQRLHEADSDVCACRVVEPYLFDVEKTAGGFRPVSVREVIRARGPTVRPDLGKQATT